VPDAVMAVPLADFVNALRSEILAAQADADSRVPIEIGPVTVEFTVLTRKEGEGKAGIRFWVVDAGVGVKIAGESTQKITMQLTPLDPSGTRSARVRDVERNGEMSPGGVSRD
jgi:hypothetical protein